MLYIYMGSEISVDVQDDEGFANGPVTIGYSTLCLQSLLPGVIGLINARRVHDQCESQYLMGLESQHIRDLDKYYS